MKRNFLRYWLIAVIGWVFLIMAIGGVTRLTGAGLSIVEWKPVTGILPPLTQDAWTAEFSKYKNFPDFVASPQMSLDEFKFLFWWEFVHRLVGRAMIAVILVPLGIFALQKRLVRKDFQRTLFLLGLGATQGALGWFMVKSGLVQEPRVSHIRLMIHFLSACMILAYLAYWLRIESGRSIARQSHGDFVFLRSLSWICFFQLALGALVAGSRAGYIYNTFPMMGNSWAPENFFVYPSVLDNFLNNQINLQFFHRIGGWLLTAAALLALRRGFYVIGGLIALQFVLGVFTLVGGVPLHLAVFHQVLGAFLFFKVRYSMEGYGKYGASK